MLFAVPLVVGLIVFIYGLVTMNFEAVVIGVLVMPIAGFGYSWHHAGR